MTRAAASSCACLPCSRPSLGVGIEVRLSRTRVVATFPPGGLWGPSGVKHTGKGGNWWSSVGMLAPRRNRTFRHHHNQNRVIVPLRAFPPKPGLNIPRISTKNLLALTRSRASRSFVFVPGFDPACESRAIGLSALRRCFICDLVLIVGAGGGLQHDLGDTPRPLCLLHDHPGVVQYAPRSWNTARGRAIHRRGNRCSCPRDAGRRRSARCDMPGTGGARSRPTRSVGLCLASADAGCTASSSTGRPESEVQAKRSHRRP